MGDFESEGLQMLIDFKEPVDEGKQDLGLKLYFPKLWKLQQDYQKWKDEGSKRPSPIDVFLQKRGELVETHQVLMSDLTNPSLQEACLQKRGEYLEVGLSTLDEVWVKHLYSGD